MRQKWHLLFAAFITIYAPLTYALGLGEITIHSKLNQALDAEIEITSATQEELADLVISVPSTEAFARYDLERPAILSNVRFNIDERSDNKKVIHITSNKVVQDPFLIFLIQADWPQGRMLREYTVLVDPPLFVPSQTTDAQSDTTQTQAYVAPAVTTTRDASAAQGTIGRDAGTSVRPSSVDSSQAAAPIGDSYRVRRGDTLWEIANKVKPDNSFSVNQTMMAIYRSNAEAFDGNINRLKSGQTLRVPTRVEVSRISREMANNDVRDQTRAWRNAASGTISKSPVQTATSSDTRVDLPSTDGTLVLKVPDLDTELGTGGSTTGGDSDSMDGAGEERIRELQTKVEEFERLLATKDNEMAALQDQLNKQYQLNTDTSLGSIGQTPETETPVTDPLVTDATDVDTTIVDSTLTPETTTPEEVKKPPVVSLPAPDESGGIMQTLKRVGIGLLAAILLGLIAVFGYRKLNRGPSHDTLFVDEDLDITAESIAEKVKSKINKKYAEEGITSEVDVAGVNFQEAVDGTEQSKESSTVVEEAGMIIDFGEDEDDDEDLDNDILSITASQEALLPTEDQSIEGGEALPFADTTLADISTGGMQLDQNDPLAETDFHMAYGLYDQAAELMQSAIEKDDNFSYKEKLLEVFFVSGNKDEFLRYVNEIKDEAISKHPGSWDNIVIMGKQLAPEEALFSGDVSTAGIDESLDFELGETGTAEVDMSLFEGLPETPEFEDSAASDLDEGALDFTLDSDESADELVSVDGSSADEDVLDLDLGIELPDAPVDLEEAIEDFSFDLDVDLGTSENVALNESDLESASPISAWDSGEDPSENTLDIDPTLITKLKEMEDATLTQEFNMADLDIELGDSSDVSDDAPEPGASDSEVMDLDLSDLNLGLGGDSEFESDDSDETLDFSFDLDKSDDIEIKAESDSDIDQDILKSAGENVTASTKKLQVDDNFDLLLDDGADDTANAALDMDLDAELQLTDEEAFADDTLKSMLPEGVKEEDSGTMRLEALDPNKSGNTDNEGFDLDDPHASTARITDDELAAMGLSEEGPDDLVEIGGMTLDDNDSVNEVNTKLDLARAYIEMEDPDNAKGILQEVIEEGNEAQRSEANDILLTLS